MEEEEGEDRNPVSCICKPLEETLVIVLESRRVSQLEPSGQEVFTYQNEF